MNPQVEKLYILSKKQSRLILGLMSGTSLDGLDLALCEIKGYGIHTKLSILRYETVDFEASFREEIKSIFAKEIVSLKMVSAMNAAIAITHSKTINKTLEKWNVNPSDVDLIASHGQTIFHAPNASIDGKKYANSTLQIGDGDHIAVLTGIITISDFRQKHVAAGGEGAPLVVYGDYLLFSDPHENRIMLNIGGISNFTFLPKQECEKELISTDVGPGNTLLNQYMKYYFDMPYDQDGKLAAKGTVNTDLLETLKKHPFFKELFPKTTGPEEFNLDFIFAAKSSSGTEHITHEDCLATLVALTTHGIASAIKWISKEEPASIYLSGGGLHNFTMVEKLQQELPNYPVNSTEVLGMPPDAKEAVLFALLANETVAGAPINFPKENGIPALCMGKISFPS